MTDMYDPAHPGEIVRKAIDAEGWTVTEAAARLGVARVTLQRVVNARADVAPRLAIALEKLGWSDAGLEGHWLLRLVDQRRLSTFSASLAGCL